MKTFSGFRRSLLSGDLFLPPVYTQKEIQTREGLNQGFMVGQVVNISTVITGRMERETFFFVA
jgi:hypothetical protein